MIVGTSRPGSGSGRRRGHGMLRLYTLTLYLLMPFVLLRLLWRSLRAPAYRQRWAERFGAFPARLDRSIWVHAVSVGETQAVEPLVKALLADHPEWPLVLTTTTPTGSAQARRLFGDSVHHGYFPYDTPAALRRFLERTRPRLLVLVETELWPNLLATCEARGITTILANGRLSERSARRYARLGEFARRLFGSIGLVAAQMPADAERFLGLGVPRERVRVTGSIKFDVRLPASMMEEAEVLRRQWGGRPVWVAASTHEGEDEPVLAAHRAVRDRIPDALLLLVPRHPERFDRVAALSQKAGFRTVRRSEPRPVTPETAVFIGDTMGELQMLLGSADAAFVGGSLVPVGGHNVLEPAALGIPVVFGPHMFNFLTIGRMLTSQGGAVQIRTASELADVIVRWLGDASERARVGETGRRVIEENRGALDRLYALVEVEVRRIGPAG